MKALPKFFLLSLISTTALCGCNSTQSASNTTATIDVTQAYQTVEAHLTQAATSVPSPTIAPSPTETVVLTPTSTPVPPTSAPTLAPDTPTATPQCDRAAPGNPIDVTIPDNTVLAPGQAFTKTWRLTNAGTCTWTTNYKLLYFSGEAMSAPAVVSLKGDVAPGQTVDISVDLVAPAKAGSYQGNWKFQNAADVWFGIGANGNSPFWVQIVVSDSSTVTITPTPGTATPGTATATPTATSSGVVSALVNGSVTLQPGPDAMNLDTGFINSGSSEDISYSVNSAGEHVLAPLNGALLGIYSAGRPGYEDCDNASLKSTSIVMEEQEGKIYLCYTTSESRTGKLLLSGFNPNTGTLDVDFLTWTTN